MSRASLVGPTAAFVVVALAACGPVPAKDVGAQLFADPAFAKSDVNAFSCATCHDLGGASKDRIFPGADLAGAVDRPSFWGGYSPSILDATNECLTTFMRGAPLTKDDPRGRALYELLATKRDGDKAAQPLTVVENVTSVPLGSKKRGAAVWAAACASCHGAPHTGDGRITPLASKVPEDSISVAEETKHPLAEVVIEKVRHGRYFGVGGTMPLFSREAISDEDLGALLAFLEVDKLTP
jgi:thiosulfate dehydrogenase